MVVRLLGNESSDPNRFTLVTPKSENDVRLQATLDNQNPMGLPVGAVRLTVLPPRVHELTIYCYDNDVQAYYTKLINARLSEEIQCDAYDHAVSHIGNHDFDCMLPIEDLEAVRHEIAV